MDIKMDWEGQITAQFPTEHLPKAIEVMKAMARGWEEAHARVKEQEFAASGEAAPTHQTNKL